MNKFGCTIIVILTYDKFQNIKKGLGIGGELTTSYGIPCFELPFKLESIEVYGNRIVIVQNNITYIIFGSHEYEPHNFRGFRCQMIYLDRKVTLTDETCYALAPTLCHSFDSENKFYNQISYKDLIKYI